MFLIDGVAVGCVKKDWNGCQGNRITAKNPNPDKSIRFPDIQLTPNVAKLKVIPNLDKKMNFQVKVRTSLFNCKIGELVSKFHIFLENLIRKSTKHVIQL